MNQSNAELLTGFDSGSDGVLTNEEGVISGKLQLRSVYEADGTLQLNVAYEGSQDWYTLAGSGCTIADPADHQVVHDLLIAVLARPSAT